MGRYAVHCLRKEVLRPTNVQGGGVPAACLVKKKNSPSQLADEKTLRRGGK